MHTSLHIRLFITILFLIVSSFSFAQTLSYEFEGSTLPPLERMRQMKTHGMSITAIQNSKIDTTMCWGTANPAQQQAVTSQTLFQAGGLTHTLTAIMILRAVDQSRVDLDTDINQYLTSWKLPQKHCKNDPVTIRQLLLKQRGFKQASKPIGYRPGEPLPTLIQILNGVAPAKNSAVQLRSGTHKQDNYSFETDVILQQLLEDIYGQSYDVIAQEQVFHTIGMSMSTCQLRLLSKHLAQASVGFTKEGLPIEGERWLHPELGSAGLWTTTTDFAKLLVALMQDAQQGNQQLLSQPLAKLAITPFHQSKTLAMNRYGTLGDCYYGGASMGFRTQFLFHPEQGWGYVVFMNSHENWHFMGETMYRLKLAFGTPLEN